MPAGDDDDMFPSMPAQPMRGADFMMQLAIHGAFSFGRRVLLAPVTRVATLLTVEGELIRQGRIEKEGFNGVIGCIKTIYIREGPYGYFRGLWTEAASSIPCTIVEEVASTLVSSVVEQLLGERAASMPQLSLLLCSIGASAAVAQISSVVHEPTQTVVSCLLADTIPAPVDNDNSSSEYKHRGARDVSRKIYQRRGLRGFFRAVALSAGASIAYRGTYYILLHMCLSTLSPQSQATYGIWFARILAIVAGIAAQPVEVLRRRLMVTAGDDVNSYDGGVLDCARTIVRAEGVLALWSGFKVRMMFTVAGFALTMIQELSAGRARQA